MILRPPHRFPRLPEQPSSLTPEFVTRSLGPILGDDRRRRIDRVIRRRLHSVTVLIERPYDPHNAAAVFRTCEAMGLLNVHVVPFVEDHPSLAFSRRVTQNADKWLNIYLHQSASDAIGFLQRSGFSCWAAKPPTLSGVVDDSTAEVAIDRPIALVIGNEHAGLTDEALALCDRRFYLPMFGFSESLNLSVSAALTVADVVGRRRALLGREGDLPDAARVQLRAAYYARSVNRPADIVLRALGRENKAG